MANKRNLVYPRAFLVVKKKLDGGLSFCLSDRKKDINDLLGFVGSPEEVVMVCELNPNDKKLIILFRKALEGVTEVLGFAPEIDFGKS